VHDGRVVVSSENVSGSAHIGRELIDLIDTGYDIAHHILVAQICHDEFVRGRLGEFVPFLINAANPVSLGLEPFHEMSSNETARTGYECSVHIYVLLKTAFTESKYRQPS
jgi:hypothetical protein